jgi:uncharacterized membrane protein
MGSGLAEKPSVEAIRATFSGRLGQIFLTGLFCVLPLALTVFALGWVVLFLHDLVGPASGMGKMLRAAGMTVIACEATAYFIGMLAAAASVFGLGLLLERGIARKLQGAVDEAMQRVPVVSTVYDASKNLTSMFDRRQDSLQGMTPVLCYFGDGAEIAVPALLPTSEPVTIAGIEYRVVLIPSAPVPFGGALFCVKAEWVKPTHCGFDELVGVYMSMGMSAPAQLSDPPAAGAI